MMGEAPPPPVLDRHGVHVDLGLFANDVLPDCAAAGLANAAQCVAALNGYGLVIDPARVEAFYAACAGVPDTFDAMAASDGAVLLDVLSRQVLHGFDIGPQQLVGIYATIPLDRASLANAMSRMGVVYLGIDLFDEDMLEPLAWSAPPTGSMVGGHAVIGFDYSGLGDHDTLRLGTWGQWVPATWMWLESRLREAHVLAWRQILHSDGLEWSGRDFDAMRAECVAYSATA